MTRFPPLTPSAPFPVWVTVWVSGFSVQDLRRYKQKEGLMPQIQREEATLSSLAQPTYCKPGFLGTPVYPPLGGASRAPGLPQAAAWRICGRSPHPLREESRTTTGKPLSRLCRPCVPLLRRSRGPPKYLKVRPPDRSRRHQAPVHSKMRCSIWLFSRYWSVAQETGSALSLWMIRR